MADARVPFACSGSSLGSVFGGRLASYSAADWDRPALHREECPDYDDPGYAIRQNDDFARVIDAYSAPKGLLEAQEKGDERLRQRLSKSLEGNDTIVDTDCVTNTTHLRLNLIQRIACTKTKYIAEHRSRQRLAPEALCDLAWIQAQLP
ncbi:hypothetical protein EMIHUDRAFT_239543 [Emiliania huxleyi CCMP1516]|uniref:Uncharacterized protein n=2 Tax=Emiliania huxleyi TaxID=2903 RepID=A0A0D3JJ63_EMIH1|nr:hypothetical protein EMIHUDRAFT_239543 [Emiliania huxleyi CCMP1516]EOD23548.1 hypothetical protein EMIHUDRAFT_239543 [Emiliania huxleyi CCMP1516]|eukprot:XP_005775977.1 hypothetical protein EMIHUDRAFT_239543 [Emiliania huxleyi CCMP1516]